MPTHSAAVPAAALSVALALGASALVAAPSTARAQAAVEGRATLQASYGLLVHFYQHEAANPYDPRFGHGVSLRLGGERCDVLCLGISALSTIPVDPAGTASVGVGPHIGYDRPGPGWGGPVTFRLGLVYEWHHIERALFDDDGQVTYAPAAGEHGVGAWIELTLELLRRPSGASPVIGLAAGYTAVVTADPLDHLLSVRATLGLAVARRLVFQEDEEGEGAEEGDLPVPEDEDEGLSPEEEQRLRDAEDSLRRW